MKLYFYPWHAPLMCVRKNSADVLVQVVVNLGLEVEQDDVPSYLLIQVVVNLGLEVEQDYVPSYLLVQVVVNLGLEVEQDDV